jgi:hypothetical protein
MCQSRPLPKQSQCVCPDTLPWLISVSLGIVGDLRRRFAGFELGAHSLDLRCLLFHGCDETCHRCFQLLSLFVFLEKLVE